MRCAEETDPCHRWQDVLHIRWSHTRLDKRIFDHDAAQAVGYEDDGPPLLHHGLSYISKIGQKCASMLIDRCLRCGGKHIDDVNIIAIGEYPCIGNLLWEKNL